MSDKGAEVLKLARDPRPKRENEGASLGNFLVSTREARGVALNDAAKETRIPGNYLRMIESNDYSLISDQLYVLPFLRRYATFLELDPEEIAMRFVREVQRADNAPAPRTLEPIEMDRPPGRKWNRKAAVAAGLVGLVVAAWLFQTYRHSRHAAFNSAMTSDNAAMAAGQGSSISH